MLALWIVATPAMASEEAENDSELASDRQILEWTRQALGGDPAALTLLMQCAPRSCKCALHAASALRHNGRPTEAVDYYEQAIRLGSSLAPLGMVQVFRDLDDVVEAFAWSQFYLLGLHEPEEILAGEALGTLAFEVLVDSAAALDDEGAELGEARAREIIEKWRHGANRGRPESGEELAASCRSHPGLSPRRRTPPRFPGEMASTRSPGWAVMELAVSHEVKVIDWLAVDFSHRSFARAAERAGRRWRFDVDDSATSEPLHHTSIIEFSTQR